VWSLCVFCPEDYFHVKIEFGGFIFYLPGILFVCVLAGLNDEGDAAAITRYETSVFNIYSDLVALLCHILALLPHTEVVTASFTCSTGVLDYLFVFND
jgi:hypothetical protein